MTDLIITDPLQLRDTMATWYNAALVRELGRAPGEAAVRAGEMSRDKNRTPMQWSAGPNGGFAPRTVETWLPVNPDHAAGINVRDQEDSPASLLNYYRRLIRVRRASPALITGEYLPLAVQSNDVVAFLRRASEQTVLVILNYSPRRQKLDLGLPEHTRGRILFSSSDRARRDVRVSSLNAGPFEVLIAELSS